MALTFTELESTTKALVEADGKKAWDNYFKTSPAVERYHKRKKGLFKLGTGTRYEMPILYDRAIGGWFFKGEPISSDQVEAVNKVYFDYKHLYSNATVLKHDEAMNTGTEQDVDMVATQIYIALNSLGIDVSEAFWGNTAEAGRSAVGVITMCSESSSTAFAHLAEDDLVSRDGEKVWEGKTTSDSEAMTSVNVRKLIASAEENVKMGPKGHISIGVTTRTLFRKFKDQLTPAQMLKEDGGTTKAGFQNIIFDGVTIIPDDFCPSGYMGVFNDNYLGFVVLKKMNFKRDPWQDMTTVKTPGRTMKIYLSMNLITNMRKAHALHSNLS